MKNIFAIIFMFGFFNANLFATIADDLTAEIIANNVQGVVNTIDAASAASVPLDQMLAYADQALHNVCVCTTPTNNNTAYRYVYDFFHRPTIRSTGLDVLWVDQSLFLSGQIGFNNNVIMTSDRIIFPTIQQAMDYLNYVRGGSWTVVINQAFYDENISVPAGQAITLTGVGGVATGNGGGASFSSTSAYGTVNWNLNDRLNVAGITPSLTLQSSAYGYGGYRYMPYMGNFTIGNKYTTTITGTITSSPILEFDSVYAFSGMGSTPIDIGPIKMTYRNFRTGGAVNFTSASVDLMETSTIIPAVVAEDLSTTICSCCANAGTITDTLIYDSWTMANSLGIFTDCVFGLTSRTMTVTNSPQTFTVNQATNYWFIHQTWTTGAGTTKVVKDQ